MNGTAPPDAIVGVQSLLDRDLSHVGIIELERRIAVPSDGKA